MKLIFIYKYRFSFVKHIANAFWSYLLSLLDFLCHYSDELARARRPGSQHAPLIHLSLTHTGARPPRPLPPPPVSARPRLYAPTTQPRAYNAPCNIELYRVTQELCF